LSVKEIIKSQDFFSTLTDTQVELLSSISTLHNYTKGYVLFYEQKQTNEMFFLTDGLAKAYKIDKHSNEIFLYYIYKNTLISEVSDLQEDFIHSFSNVELVEDSCILSIDYKKFKKLFLDKHILCRAFTNEVIKRSTALQTLINREFIFDSVAKVAKMLDADLEMFNSLKRNEISLILHIQPATLSRVLNRLKRNKIIDIIHGRVIVVDRISLVGIYEE
jgi:CRP/FNR family transcriptional regulator